MMNYKIIAAAILTVSSSAVFAEFAPFDHDVRCVHKDTSASVEIVYNKKEFPGLGRPGGIHIRFNAGNDYNLNNLVVISKLSTDGTNQVFERTGAAGQVANWISQESDDPFNIHARVGFTNYELKDENNQTISTAYSFISDFRLKKLSTGYFAMRLLDDYQTTISMFKADECKTLN